MKTAYILINIFLILNINSCLAQDKKPKTDTITSKSNMMNRPQLNDAFEKLNLNDFNGLVITKERIKVDINKWEDVEVYEYNKDDGKESIRLTGSFIGSSCYTSTKVNSPYTVVKTYYKNGGINRKWIESNNYIIVKLGKEYRFNENGQLEKVIDHDLEWNFSFEDVLQYILNRGLSIKHEDGYWSTEISKKESESEDCRKYWEVIVDTRKLTKSTSDTWEVIKIDTKTGEILSQIEYEGDRIVPSDFEVPLPTIKVIKEDRTSNKIYQTYKGKSYTYDQWLKFQEEFHEELKQNKK